MKFILTDFDEFVNEELRKIPAQYNYTSSPEADKKHNRLASKKKDGHQWKKIGTKKTGEKSITKNYECDCGYKKLEINDEDQNVTITYKKS